MRTGSENRPLTCTNAASHGAEVLTCGAAVRQRPTRAVLVPLPVVPVLKRWAASASGSRWLAGIAAAVLGLAFVWVLFVPLADLLARHDVGSASGALHETALDNARTGC